MQSEVMREFQVCNREFGRLCQITLGAILFLQHLSLFGYEFGIEGKVTYQIFSPQGEVQVEQQDMFIFSLSGCKWHIRKNPQRFIIRGKEQPLMGYTEVSSDTTNFYQMTSTTSISQQNDFADTNAFVGRIGPGAMPFNLTDPKLIILWYAFASSCYLTNSTLDMDYINPPTVLGTEDKYAHDFRVLATWRLNTNPPYLPEVIAFDQVPRCDLAQREIADKQWHFTNCTYAVQEFTQAHGLVIPKLAIAEFFATNRAAVSAIRCTARVTIQAVGILHSISIESFRPNIPGPAFISDMRTISKTTPYGVAVDSRTDWPDFKESQANANARMLYELKTTENNTQPTTKHTLLLMAMVSVAILILTWGVVKPKRKTQV